MDWFPSLICNNYIFKHFVKTAEVTSLKFCIKLVTLHLEHTIAQVKNANYSNAHAHILVLLNGEIGTVFTCFRKAEILDVQTLGCLLPETNRFLKDFKLY